MITRSDFGRYAGQVDDFGGELTLAVGLYEIHPCPGGDWAVVSPTGDVLVKFANIDDAVDNAKARQS
jgi:hypothetical protein